MWLKAAATYSEQTNDGAKFHTLDTVIEDNFNLKVTMIDENFKKLCYKFRK